MYRSCIPQRSDSVRCNGSTARLSESTFGFAGFVPRGLLGRACGAFWVCAQKDDCHECARVVHGDSDYWFAFSVYFHSLRRRRAQGVFKVDLTRGARPGNYAGSGVAEGKDAAQGYTLGGAAHPPSGGAPPPPSLRSESWR